MKELLDTLDAWAAEGVEAGRAGVIRTFGSAPRPEGATLLLARDGRIAGSVSGGCVEAAAAEEIERAWRTGHSRVIRYGITDEQAWDVGLACGGTIDVLVEPHVPAMAITAARAAAERRSAGQAVVTPLPADAPGAGPGPHASGEGAVPPATVTVEADGSLHGSLGDPGVDVAIAAAGEAAIRRGTSRTIELGGRQAFVEAFAPRPRLVVIGATEVARALVALARPLGFETVVVDGRAAFVTPERFPDADRLLVGWPDESAEVLGLGPEDAVAILSHDPKFDEPAVEEALRRGVRYVGAIGSRKTQADRRARLRAAGLDDGELARLHGPVGLDLGGREPPELALAILAEVVATRYGGSGRPLVERSQAPEG
ncbi:MAG TPA: XdhC family protein [Candidatus Limnocylindrales bacterium]